MTRDEFIKDISARIENYIKNGPKSYDEFWALEVERHRMGYRLSNSQDCPNCHHPPPHKLVHTFRNGGKVLRCNICGLVTEST